MPVNAVSLDKNIHRLTKVKETTTYESAINKQICDIQFQEIFLAATYYPLLFSKNNDNFHCVAMLGLVPGENLYYNANKWKVSYVPNAIKLEPWSMKVDNNNNTISLNIDTRSDLVNNFEGQPLFNNDGEESLYLKKIKSLALNIHQQSFSTNRFIHYLETMKLLTEHNFTLTTGDKSKMSLRVSDVYVIDKLKLQKLSNNEFVKLRENDFLPAIYAHMVSLNLIPELAARRATLDRGIKIKPSTYKIA